MPELETEIEQQNSHKISHRSVFDVWGKMGSSNICSAYYASFASSIQNEVSWTKYNNKMSQFNKKNLLHSLKNKLINKIKSKK